MKAQLSKLLLSWKMKLVTRIQFLDEAGFISLRAIAFGENMGQSILHHLFFNIVKPVSLDEGKFWILTKNAPLKMTSWHILFVAKVLDKNMHIVLSSWQRRKDKHKMKRWQDTWS